MWKDWAALEREVDDMRAEARGILDRAGGADLTGADAQRFDQLTGQIEERNQEFRDHDRQLDEIKRAASGDPNTRIRLMPGSPGRDDEDRPAARQRRAPLKGAQILTRDQSLVDWGRDNGYDRTEEAPSFDKYLRGIVSGRWEGAEHERALSEGTLTAGGHLVPLPLASRVLDLARNQTRVFQAGAVTVPMLAQTLKIPRLVTENSPAWRAENAAITPADMTFDAVTFTARSLARLIILSRELFEDSDPSVGDVIGQSFAAQIAVELDRVALRGTGTPPEPRGVLNTSGITTTTHGANGANITNYDWFLDAAGVVRNGNREPNAHIVAPRTTTSLSKLKEATTNAYMAAPQGLLPILPTSQVPVNLTVGASTDCSEIYTGAWENLAVGMRQGFEIEFLRERYADNLQYAFLAHLRADVQVLQPTAFVVDTGVRT